jgi:hypothetical protein
MKGKKGGELMDETFGLIEIGHARTPHPSPADLASK